MRVLKKVGIGIGIAFGVFIVLALVVAFTAVQNIQEKEKPVSQPTIGDTQAEKPESEFKSTDNEFSINDTAIVAGIAHKVTAVKTESQVDIVKNLVSEEAVGTYVRVSLEIENLRKETAQAWPDQFILIDGKDRQFDYVIVGFGWTGGDIQPNLPIKATVSFDVPFDESLEYKLKIKPPTFSLSSDEVIFNLGKGIDFQENP